MAEWFPVIFIVTLMALCTGIACLFLAPTK